MDRSTINSQQQARLFDVMQGWKDGLKGLGYLVQATLGSVLPVVSGFSASQQASPNMTINLALGQIYSIGQVDPTPWGGSSIDTSLIIQQGLSLAQILTFTTAGLTAGQQQYCLVSAAFAQVDGVRAGDPTDGVTPYYNAALPSQPLQGPGGGGAIQNTVRQGAAILTQTYGAPAASGSAVPPSVPANNVPMYLVLLSFGQATITNGQILTAGTAAYPGYQQAPFWAGALNSHHNGLAGQAPQIQLSNGLEVQGVLPLANTAASSAGYTATANYDSGILPVLRFCIVNPNGNMAGALHDLAYNTLTGNFYLCTTAGTAGTASWAQIGTSSGLTDIYVNTSPFTVTNLNACHQIDASTASITFNMPTVSTSGNAQIEAVQVGIDAAETNTVSLVAAGSDKFMYNNAISTTLTLHGLGDSRTMRPLTIASGIMAGTYWLVA